jgi:release factor glutamine methyltransferase
MQSVIQYIEKELEGLYPKTEIESFARICVEYVCGFNYTQFILHKNEKINPAERKKIEAIVYRLKKHEPIQYILGETEFFGLKLKVNPSVLIPRPETEELVQWILESDLKTESIILDIGTGSGCIALALKSNIPAAKVYGVDFSKEALKTAVQNGKENNLEVDFLQADILNWEQKSWNRPDLIVSNPPYVRELEKKKMQSNVLDYEPETALFVSDSDPLLFYRRIAEFALKYLNPNGGLFFEINENLGNETLKMLELMGFQNCTIKADLFGKERMFRCRKQKE